MTAVSTVYPSQPFLLLRGALTFGDTLDRVLGEIAKRTTEETSKDVSEQDVMTPFVDLNRTARSATRDSIAAATIDELAINAIGELEEYLSLRKGWDGYRGEAFDKDVVRSAQRIVANIADRVQRAGLVVTEITPGPISDGSVNIEISTDEAYFIVTLDASLDRIRLYTEDKSGSGEETFP